MITISRYVGNPILSPDPDHPWETEATFNGCPIFDGNITHLLYRAISKPQKIGNNTVELSTIGYAGSSDRVHFTNHRQFIIPEYEYERFGCEDPRITKIDGNYYIFYTGLEVFPPSPDGIKIGVAISKDLKKIDEKHLITHFNSKAMALFPERVNGKFTAVLTVHTDLPPSTIAIAQVDRIEEFWNKSFWDSWYRNMDLHSLPILRSPDDHVEVGAPPILVSEGWILIYCYIRNYRSSYKSFGIEAVLLDRDNPLKLIGRTAVPLLTPDEDYERYGKINNVIFPSGALLYNDTIGIYYGAGDNTLCLATVDKNELIKEMKPKEETAITFPLTLSTRFPNNPLLSPIYEHKWESRYAFNPAAIYENGAVHLLYRAMGSTDTSVMGYAVSSDGIHIDERLPYPIYQPRIEEEQKKNNGNSGCEDPRLTRIGERIYLTYTAYDGVHPTHVALSSISQTDFIRRIWNWSNPVIISPMNEHDKDAGILPEMINGSYIFFHRLGDAIWIDQTDNLSFNGDHSLRGTVLLKPNPENWDSDKVGIAGPPFKTPAGWLLIYHGLSKTDRKYRLGAILLDINNPSRIIGKIQEPILEPQAPYENNGFRPGTVFSNGSVLIHDIIYIYYGGADQYVCGATLPLKVVLNLFDK